VDSSTQIRYTRFLYSFRAWITRLLSQWMLVSQWQHCGSTVSLHSRSKRLFGAQLPFLSLCCDASGIRTQLASFSGARSSGLSHIAGRLTDKWKLLQTSKNP